MFKKTLTLLFALFIVACTKPPAATRDELDTRSHDGEGQLFIAELAAAIRSADRIVVSEHSIGYDVLDEKTQPELPVNYKPIIYANQELTLTQRAAFLNSVTRLAPGPVASEPACIFEPHHTIAFYRAGQQTSAMDICFQCGQLEWNGTTGMRPQSLVPSLGKLVTSLGMHEKRDWYALAKTRQQ